MPRPATRAAVVTSVTEEDLSARADLITPVVSPPPSPPLSPVPDQHLHQHQPMSQQHSSPVTRVVIPPLHPADLFSLSLSLATSRPPAPSPPLRRHQRGLPASAPATPAPYRFTPGRQRHRVRPRSRRMRNHSPVISVPSPTPVPSSLALSRASTGAASPVVSSGVPTHCTAPSTRNVATTVASSATANASVFAPSAAPVSMLPTPVPASEPAHIPAPAPGIAPSPATGYALEGAPSPCRSGTTPTPVHPPPQIVHDVPGPRVLPRPAPTRALPLAAASTGQEAEEGTTVAWNSSTSVEADSIGAPSLERSGSSGRSGRSGSAASPESLSTAGPSAHSPATFFVVAFLSCVAAVDLVTALMFVAIVASARRAVVTQANPLTEDGRHICGEDGSVQRTPSTREANTLGIQGEVTSPDAVPRCSTSERIFVDDVTNEVREGTVDAVDEFVREGGREDEDIPALALDSSANDTGRRLGSLRSYPGGGFTERRELVGATSPSPSQSRSVPRPPPRPLSRRSRLPPISIALVDSDSDNSDGDGDDDNDVAGVVVLNEGAVPSSRLYPHGRRSHHRRPHLVPAVTPTRVSSISTTVNMPPRVATPIPQLVDARHPFESFGPSAAQVTTDRVVDGNRPVTFTSAGAVSVTPTPREVLVPRFTHPRRSTSRSLARPSLSERQSDAIHLPPHRLAQTHSRHRGNVQRNDESSSSHPQPGQNHFRFHPVYSLNMPETEQTLVDRSGLAGSPRFRRIPRHTSVSPPPRPDSMHGVQVSNRGSLASSPMRSSSQHPSRARSPPVASTLVPHPHGSPRLGGGRHGTASNRTLTPPPQYSLQHHHPRSAISPSRARGPRGNRALLPSDQHGAIGASMATGGVSRVRASPPVLARRVHPAYHGPRAATPPAGTGGSATLENGDTVGGGRDSGWRSPSPTAGSALAARSHRPRHLRAGITVSSPRGTLDRRAIPGRPQSPFISGESGGSSDSDGISGLNRPRRSSYAESPHLRGISHRTYSYSRPRSMRRGIWRDYNFRSTMESEYGRMSDTLGMFDLEIEEVNDDEFVDQDDDDFAPLNQNMRQSSMHWRVLGRESAVYRARRFSRGDRDSRASRRVAPREVLERLQSFTFERKKSAGGCKSSSTATSLRNDERADEPNSCPTESVSYEEPERCAICFTEYEEGMSLRTLPCSHDFCACVERWLANTANCPICRTPVCGGDDLLSPSSVSVQSSSSSAGDFTRTATQASSGSVESSSTPVDIERMDAPQVRRPFFL